MEGRRVAVGSVLLSATVTAWIGAALVAASHQPRSYVVALVVAGFLCVLGGVIAFDGHRVLRPRRPKPAAQTLTPDQFGERLAEEITYLQDALRVVTKHMAATRRPD